MALTTGARLGHYEVTALIGEGGMGQVYRARDRKLRRDVALKILPEAFASDPERLARFRREAQVLASLNHPGIAAIFGFEENDGTQALVLELVEGPTLADRIAHGPIPLDEALPIAKQIAEALDAAHEQAVIHRDLKPANIKVRRDGTVKVLDFGLAKALASMSAGDDGAPTSPTSTSAAMVTGTGVILGTAAYMSPEQARGKAVDKRADIWAFGCVLYEMLTGKRAFAADDFSGTLAGVLMTEPVWDALPDGTPASIRRLLQCCLQKETKRRLRDIGDVAFLIEDAQNAAPSLAATAGVPKSREWLWWLAAMLIVIVIWMTVLFFRQVPAPQASPAVARLTVALPAGDHLGSLNASSVALSPAGTQLAYVGLRGGKQNLYLRSLGGLESEAISGTEGATSPFFSPDGRWIGFFALGKLKKVSVAGGIVETLCDAPGRDAKGGSWGPDDSIYFTMGGFSGLWMVSASGGSPTEVTTLDRTRGEVSHRWPHVPDGKAVMFTVWTGPGFDEQQIDVQSFLTSERHVLVRGGTTGRYVATGHLVYARADALMAVRMDLSRREAMSDAPVLLTEQVRVGGEGGAHYAVSESGQFVYVPGNVRR